MNVATVDLENPTTEDISWLKNKINEFVKATGSEIGNELLKDWEGSQKSFVKARCCYLRKGSYFCSK